MKHWKHALFLIFFCAVLLAQDAVKSTVSLTVGVRHYDIKCHSPEEYEQVQLQTKLNALILDALAEESKGLHPYSQLRQIKELTKGLRE